MALSYDEVLDSWKNFLQAASGMLQFEQVIEKLNHLFSDHYHSVKYDSKKMIYMESMSNTAYQFEYDIILRDDKQFNKDAGGDVQVIIMVELNNFNNRDKERIQAVEFIYKHCNPDCRSILERGTIQLL